MSDLDTTGLDQVIADLRRLPSIAEAMLPKMAEQIIERIGENIAAQKAPDGSSWKPGIEGRPVLTGAKKALSYKVSGSTVVISLGGVEARHHFGMIKGAGSIQLGAGGKRRDTGHRAGERAKIAARTGEALRTGGKEAYARPILPGAEDETVLRRAFKLAVEDGMSKTVWKAAR